MSSLLPVNNNGGIDVDSVAPLFLCLSTWWVTATPCSVEPALAELVLRRLLAQTAAKEIVQMKGQCHRLHAFAWYFVYFNRYALWQIPRNKEKQQKYVIFWEAHAFGNFFAMLTSFITKQLLRICQIDTGARWAFTLDRKQYGNNLCILSKNALYLGVIYEVCVKHIGTDDGGKH